MPNASDEEKKFYKNWHQMLVASPASTKMCPSFHRILSWTKDRRKKKFPRQSRIQRDQMNEQN